jgi:hypothetical protein
VERTWLESTGSVDVRWVIRALRILAKILTVTIKGSKDQQQEIGSQNHMFIGSRVSS